MTRGPHYSEQACRQCGVHHRLDEFRLRSLVIVVSGPHAGARGVVHGWSQYGQSISYRIAFEFYVPDVSRPDVKRVNFAPCELMPG